MVLNDLVDSFCYSQKNAGLKGLTATSSLQRAVEQGKYGVDKIIGGWWFNPENPQQCYKSR